VAFPETPLGLRAEARMGLVWTDITARVKLSDPIVHSRGTRSGGGDAEPATVPLKVDNKDGALSPRNPMSPYDGLFGLNTPVRLWLPDGPHFLDLDGDPANIVTTPDAAPLDITGDLDLRVELETNWYGPTSQMLIGKWDAAGDQRSYLLRLQNGSLNLHYSSDGTSAGSFFHGRVLPALPEHAALRATLDVDNGAGGKTARFYWAPSLDGPWTQFGADSTLTGTITLHSGTATLSIAPSDLTQARVPVEGKVYKAEVRPGIGGTAVANPDFEAQPLGATSFADAAGSTWSFSGNAAVADRQDIFYGEISTWPQRWVPSEEAVWMPVQASGLLRRLGQGQKPLDSTLRRRIPSGNPIAYWPFEEEQAASRAYSPIEGVTPAAVTGVEWASVDTLPSSKALPRLAAAASLSAIVPAAADGEWQVEFVYNADDKAPPTAGPRAELISISTTGTIRRWVVSLRKDAAHLFGYDASGTAVVSQAVNAVEDIFHGWFRLKFYVQDLGGGQMEWALGWANVSAGLLQLAKTITAEAGHVTAVTANWGALSEGWSIGHLSVLPDAANTIYNGSDSAYEGETAWERMRRLSVEQGVPMARIAGQLEPERVGPQRPARLLELLQAAADADGGLLLEDRRRLGLVYRDRSSMYTQEPALTLVYKTPPLAPPLEPDDDADVTRNDRTVKRDGGSEARAILKEGRLSVQDAPDGIGLYDDSFTLSLADDTQTGPIAYWLLHLGTYDGARYPSVTIRLHRAPALIPQVLAMREGDLIRIKGLPGFVAYGDVDVIVTGWTETLKPRTWERTFICEPGGPWNTAKASHATYGKADTSGHELAAAVTAEATTLPVRATAGLPWVSVNPVMNANADFEEGLAPWTGADAAIERVAVVQPAPFRNEWCIEITPDGVGEFPNAGSEQFPAVAGLDYVLSGWLRCAVARNVALNANWFDGGGVYITTGDNTQFVEAGVWTWFEETFTAPVGTATVNLAPTVPAFPPSTDVLEATKVTMRPAGGMPREFPIPVQVGGEVVSVNAVTPGVVDTFRRTTTPGWGTPDVGAAWTASGGSGTDHYTQGAEAAHLLSNVDVPRFDLTAAAGTDHDVQADIATAALATGGPQLVAVVARATDGDNLYMGQLSISTTQTITLTLRKRVAGTETQLATVTTTLTHAAFAFFRVRLQVVGTELKARVWPAAAEEPLGWQVTASDSSLTTGGSIGCRSVRQTANTNAGLVVSWDNVQLLGPQAFSVERSVNGVVKAHAAGSAVRLAHPAPASL
jgi:hypothetical protein